MPGFTDCPGCEFADRPETCHALATGCTRFCTLIQVLGREDYRGLIHRKTLGLPEPSPPAATDRLAIAIELCDFRYSSCGCLGKPARCRLGGYAAIVSREWCEGCDETKERGPIL
jgi:hypothetical protein